MRWLRDIDQWLVEQVIPHAPALRSLAARLIGRDEADDLVHETYARLLDYSRWREIEDPRAFALRTVRNLALERLRRSTLVRIDQLAELDAVGIVDETPDAFRVHAGRVELTRLLALIDALPAKCGRVVRMRKLDGLSPAEIAVSLGLSVSTVEKHLAKGLARIAEGLRDEDRKGPVWSRAWSRRRRS